MWSIVSRVTGQMDEWAVESPWELTLQGMFTAQFGAHTPSLGAIEGFRAGDWWMEDVNIELGRVKLQKAKYNCCVPGLPVRGPRSPWSPCPPPPRPSVSKGSSSPDLFGEGSWYLGRTRWTQQRYSYPEAQGCCALGKKVGAVPLCR